MHRRDLFRPKTSDRAFIGAVGGYSLAALLLISCVEYGHAELPRQLSAFGITLGESPEKVTSTLGRLYSRCAVAPSIYHESEGYPPEVVALLEIRRGTLIDCRAGPAGADVADAISATFAHPSLSPDQPLYQLDVQRTYPDVVLEKQRRISYSYDTLRADLIRTYGKPTQERTEKISSTSADLAKSLEIGQDIRREDQLVRFLWASKGRIEASRESLACDCGERYVRADIEVSRSPSTTPKNQFYVLLLNIFIQDAPIAAKQDVWNSQWQRGK